MNLTLSSAADSMQGVLHGSDRAFAGISTDTRTVNSDELFFALSGPNFDGGDFVTQAAAQGAAGAVVASQVDDDIAQIVVDDTRLALGRLGSAWRQQHTATVVGVTGSNGKTTLKEMISACLAKAAPTIATAGNLNNEIGMPLMLLRIDSTHRYAVLEMGANHGGEIAYLTSLALPDVVVISNAGASHLEGFGSLTGVAHGKGEILQGDPRPQFAVLNADDEYYSYWLSLVDDVEVLSFGLSDSADVYATHVHFGKENTSFQLHLADTVSEIQLPLVGLHNVRNACAAAAVAVALDITAAQIKAALEMLEPVSGRLQALVGLHGATVYDDSYNANPVSVMAAGAFMAGLDGENWMVLGDMGELGDEAVDLHGQVGQALQNNAIDRVFAVGELSKATIAAFGEHGEWFDDIHALITRVADDMTSDVNVLVKGSRAACMERVVAAIRGPEDVRREA